MITAPTNSMQIGAKTANALSSVGFTCTLDEIPVDSFDSRKDGRNYQRKASATKASKAAAKKRTAEAKKRKKKKR